MYQFPVGVSSFRKLVTYQNSLGEKYLYVDKTKFIEEIDNDGAEVILIVRPRRFGKTTNLSMLECFYAKEVDGMPTKGLFDNLEISKNAACMKSQGTQPVIFLSLKDIQQDTYEECMDKFKTIMAKLYKRYRSVLLSDKISEYDRNDIDSIMQEKCMSIQLENSLKRLIKYFNNYYNVPPIVLIDEYDAPLQYAQTQGYYDDLRYFMNNFLRTALNENRQIRKSVLTGILRVDDLFDDFNYVSFHSVSDEKYAPYFGFAEKEVSTLFAKAKLEDCLESVKKEFKGYQFGKETIYNPWSIINVLEEKGALDTYWVDTGGSSLIRKIMENSAPDVKDEFITLLSGEPIEVWVDYNVVCADLLQNASAMWGFLLMTGYLKQVAQKSTDYGCFQCKLMIPNKEVEKLYKKIAVTRFLQGGDVSWYLSFLKDLTTGNIKAFEEKLKKIMLETMSYQDAPKTEKEFVKHHLTLDVIVMLGVVAGLKNDYKIKSNRESGKDRYDVVMTPYDKTQNGIVMEFKAIDEEKHLVREAKTALAQIDKKGYVEEMLTRGVQNIIKMGIAFAKKDVKVVSG